MYTIDSTFLPRIPEVCHQRVQTKKQGSLQHSCTNWTTEAISGPEIGHKFGFVISPNAVICTWKKGKDYFTKFCDMSTNMEIRVLCRRLRRCLAVLCMIYALCKGFIGKWTRRILTADYSIFWRWLTVVLLLCFFKNLFYL